MEKYLRQWRQDALNKHQHDAAIFIGDKLLALTNDDKDAFWLAQVHFSTGNYTRAQGFLSRGDLVARNASCRYLLAHCLIKQSRYDEALSVLGEKNPTHLISSNSNSRRKLQHSDASSSHPPRNGSTSTASRAPKKPSHHPKDHPPKPRPSSSSDDADADADAAADVKFEAAICHLRGLCYAQQNAFDLAKESYKTAVLLDVQCFEAFDQLMRNSLLSPDEEWAFLSLLPFDSISVPSSSASTAQEAAEFTKLLYTTRLSTYKNPSAFTSATETLATHYNLASNPDLLLSRASLLFTQCRFASALAITTSILSADKHNFAIYPLHLACLHELNSKNALFLIAHDLADHHPHEPATWLAVGVYYLTTHRVADARRYFSKASMMDPHFGPAWIGFAHTFAAEGEHDQAISAYSTAARLFQGTHLPQLFLGMQNLELNNLTLADDYLKSAYKLCRTDPLLLNEMGVVFYHQDHLQPAVEMFTAALELADHLESEPTAWLATRANLAHAHRRMGRYAQALALFEDVLRAGGGGPGGGGSGGGSIAGAGGASHGGGGGGTGGRGAGGGSADQAAVFCAKGLVLLHLNRPADAIAALHLALSAAPQDPVATDLLGKALVESSHEGVGGGGGGASGQGSWREGGAGGKKIAKEGESFASGTSGGGSGVLEGEEEAFELTLKARKYDALLAARTGDTSRERKRRGGGGALAAEGEESMMELEHDE